MVVKMVNISENTIVHPGYLDELVIYFDQYLALSHIITIAYILNDYRN